MSRLHSVGRGRRVARLNVSLGSFALPFALLLCLATSSLKGAQALKYVGKYDDNARSRGVRGRYGSQHTKGGRYLSAGRRVGGVSIGRRLLDAVSDGVDTNATTAAEPPELEPSASGAKVVTDANKASCVTALDIIETHPNLTILRDVIADLPTIRAALSDPTAADTLFAPVDDAVEGYRRWAGYDETDEGRKAGLISLLGRDDEPEVENWREFLVAYHAVPDKALKLDDLCELEGDDDVLEDAAEAMMPLMVIHPDIMDYRPCSAAIAGMGSIATILDSQMTCGGGVVHLVDTCLLPFDGDGILDRSQVSRLRHAKKVLDSRHPDRPTIIKLPSMDDPNVVDDGADEAEDEQEKTDASDSPDGYIEEDTKD